MNLLIDKEKLLTFGFIILSGIAILSSTKLAFEKFNNDGIIELSNIFNYIALIYIFSSLSVESGVIKKFSTLEKKRLNDLFTSLACLYVFGIFLAVLYVYLENIYAKYIFNLIPLIILYFPLIIIRSKLISSGKQPVASFITFSISFSYFIGTYFTKDINNLFVNIIFFNYLIISILILSFFSYLIIQNKLFFRELSIKPINTSHLKISFDLLKFGMHSSSSGIQDNLAMLIRRLFLINLVTLEFSALMEMYQKPLIWILSVVTAVIGYYYYPYIINFEKSLDTNNPMQAEEAYKDNIILVLKLTLLSVIFFSLGFPFIFWFTFGFDIQIDFLFLIFWIFIFSLRVAAALLSSWLLAKNMVRNAIFAEIILYMPTILIFYIFSSSNMSSNDAFYLFFTILGLSSTIQIIYFIFKLKINFKNN